MQAEDSFVSSRLENKRLKVIRPAEPARNDRQFLSEATFQSTIAVERARTERSDRPFVLMLVDVDVDSSETRLSLIETVMRVLQMSTRDTDIVGWYKNEEVAGVMFTELLSGDDSAAAVPTMLARVSNQLREQYRQANSSM
jgi:hypothetical protein